jgi:hypothetical protein
MVNYKELRVDDFSLCLRKVGMNFIAGVISVSAVIAITSAFLYIRLAAKNLDDNES